MYTARLSASNCAWSISFAFDVDVFVFDVISLPFSFPVGDVSDDDDAVTDVILFSCISWVFNEILHKTKIVFERTERDECEYIRWAEGRDITIKLYEKFAYK